MKAFETEVIDKLFLELSQVTKAQTKKEREMLKYLINIYASFRYFANKTISAKQLVEVFDKVRLFLLENKYISKDNSSYTKEAFEKFLESN